MKKIKFYSDSEGANYCIVMNMTCSLHQHYIMEGCLVFHNIKKNQFINTYILVFQLIISYELDPDQTGTLFKIVSVLKI